MANKRLIMILESGLKAKKLKTVEDEVMIKLLRRYIDNAEENLPKTQINKDDLDDDEQKKDDQKSSGSNSSQSSKAVGGKDGDNKKDEKKGGDETQRKSGRRAQQRGDGSEPHQSLKIQTQIAQPLTQTSSITKSPQTSKLKHLYKQTANSFLKIPITTTSQTSLKKISNLPSVKPSLKIHFKSVGRKSKKAKIINAERAIWNCFKQSDFLPLNWCNSDEDHFQQLAEEIVRVWVVTLKEVRIYFQNRTFSNLGRNLMDTLSSTEIKRVISLMKDKDTATRAWRSVLAEWLIAREDRRAKNKAEYEENMRKYDEEIEIYIKRSEELKAKGMSRISKDGRFLNVKAGSFSRFRIQVLDGYSKQDILKLIEALTRTPIIEELEILMYLKDLMREESNVSVVV